MSIYPAIHHHKVCITLIMCLLCTTGIWGQEMLPKSSSNIASADKKATGEIKKGGAAANKLLKLFKSLEEKAKLEKLAREGSRIEKNEKLSQSLIVNDAPHLSHHQLRRDQGFKTERQWDTIQKGDYTQISSPELDSVTTIQTSDFEILGFHPYWMGSAYKQYKYNLLSTIAYFCYDINPSSGSYKQLYSWRTTSLIDSATQYNVKTLLTVTNFGALNNRQFLNSQRAMNTFCDSVIQILSARNGTGVCLDFEEMPADCRTKLTSFVSMLYTRLKAKGTYSIYVALPAVDYHASFNVVELSNYVQKFVVMCYDYYSHGSTLAGPNAPLFTTKIWEPYSVDSSINYYMNLGIESKKILMGIPYYGTTWQTNGKPVPSESKGYIGSMLYSQIEKLYGPQAGNYDSIIASSYINYLDGQVSHQLWKDDKATLLLKYTYVQKKKLGGIAIWALGYDNGSLALWEAINEGFNGEVAQAIRADSSLAINTPQPSPVKQSSIISSFLQGLNAAKTRGIIIAVLIVIALFLLIGFLAGLAQSNIQQFLKDKATITYLALSCSMVIAIVLLELTIGLAREWLMLLFGLLTATMAFSTFLFLKKNKKHVP